MCCLAVIEKWCEGNGLRSDEEEAALRSDELVTIHGGESSRARMNFPGAEHINLDEIIPEKLPEKTPEPVEKLPQEVVVAAKEPTKKIVKRRKK